MDIVIQNCNNILNGRVSLVEGALNILIKCFHFSLNLNYISVRTQGF